MSAQDHAMHAMHVTHLAARHKLQHEADLGLGSEYLVETHDVRPLHEAQHCDLALDLLRHLELLDRRLV